MILRMLWHQRVVQQEHTPVSDEIGHLVEGDFEVVDVLWRRHDALDSLQLALQFLELLLGKLATME